MLLYICLNNEAQDFMDLRPLNSCSVSPPSCALQLAVLGSSPKKNRRTVVTPARPAKIWNTRRQPCITPTLSCQFPLQGYIHIWLSLSQNAVFP